MGPDAANDLLSNALFLISAGSNDMFDYQRSNGGGISTNTLLTNLRDNYTIYLKHLYELGARKFGIISVPPIGCCPFERYANKFLNGGLGCFDEMNQLALAFYSSIEALLREFSTQFPGVKYSLGNTYNMTIPIINNPYTFGFKYAEEACCGSGPFNGQYECNISSNLCPDRKDYLFWDWFHPTQAVSKLAALTLYYGSTDYTSPMNLSQLVLPDI
ncbi:hypothetical protein F0562_006817 [Nyssa sinensis]|uniref:SGNH hydrolase-type esterase domain-containing protein n=1 Tax=Nyssa sinensis TaxID=561372 RepID=A0A5J5ASR3_9ASTE|nr:hypothetical protein F0562_006817 [Nyssa sinensis]